MQIQMVDLKRQYQKYKTDFDAAVKNVMDSAYYINGPDVKNFTAEMQEYLGVKHAIPCANGTDALQIALMSLEIGPGDEVITTPFTFVATAETIGILGAKPVYVDIDPKTYNIDPAKIEAAINENTKAIIPVHIFGQSADMDPIMEIGKKHDIPVIEDAAQAVGARYKAKRVCSIGDFACISFFPSKNLGAAGDGGMVVSNSDELAEKAKMIANHGSRIRYEHEILGVNSRLDSLQAAILRVKLAHLDEWNARRRQIAAQYNQAFEKFDVITPFVADYAEAIFHQYTIQVADRAGLQAYLNECKIPNAIHYPIPLHLQPAFKKVSGFNEGDFPVAEAVAGKVISLPMHPDLNADEIAFIIEKVSEFLNK